MFTANGCPQNFLGKPTTNDVQKSCKTMNMDYNNSLL